MKVKINVTADDIRKGIRRSTMFCPVANALSHRINGRVWLFEKIGIGPNGYVCDTPADAFSRIVKFDQTGEMEPFSFAIDVPKHLVKKERKKANGRAGKKPRAVAKRA